LLNFLACPQAGHLFLALFAYFWLPHLISGLPNCFLAGLLDSGLPI